MKKFVLGGAALTVLALGAAACGESTVKQEADKKPETPSAKVEQRAQKVLEKYEQAVEEQQEAETPTPATARVGDPITVETEQSEAGLTVESVTDPIEPYVDPEFGDSMDEPQGGNRFFGVSVQVKNTGSAPIDPSMEFTNVLVMRDGIEAEEGFLSETKPWDSYNDAKIAPGASLLLNLPFEAPTGVKPDRFQVSVYNADFDETTAEWKLA
jgi:hypothetical protein